MTVSVCHCVPQCAAIDGACVYLQHRKYSFNVNAPNNQHLVDLSITTTTGEVVPLVQGGVDVPANLARSFTFVTTNGSPAQQVPNTTAVDELVAYIRGKGTISPKIDDRTVQLDNGPSNIADWPI